MVKSFKKIFLSIFVCAFLALGWLSGVFLHEKPTASAVEFSTPTTTQQSNISIFIRKPIYSVVYENKIYFIDDGDKRLKIYNIASEVFESAYADLSAYTILDVNLCGDELYLLVSQETFNKLVKINLSSNLEKPEIDDLEIDKTYTNFTVSGVEISSKTYFIFTFTSNDKNKKSSFAVFDKSENKFINLSDSNKSDSNKISEISFNDSGENYNTNILKIIGYSKTTSNTTNNYLLFLYDNRIIGYEIASLENIKALATISRIKLFNRNFSFLANETIKEAGVMSIDGSDYLAIAYSVVDENGTTECMRLYSVNIGESENSISLKKEIDCLNSNHATFSENNFSYADANLQALYFVKFSVNIDTIVSEKYEIANPDVEVTYLSADEFVYKTANKQTKLFDNPWGATSNITIDQSTDVVKIGTGYLKINQQEIADYDYCMFTNINGNHFGFVARGDLDEKQDVSIEKYGKILTDESTGETYVRVSSIWQNASLYSLPTTSNSAKIGSSEVGISEFVAKKIMEVPSNSEVFVLDCLCEYTPNGVTMLKVKINGENVGYIEARCVRTQNDVVDFVITNATIKNDNTKVYLTASSDASTLSFALNKGKNVRINGKRDTKTGFTSITFNDEFGNEFSGYIMTDYIKADSWSTLQIVGCILIAINIGLLILILIFKHNHLGSHGQKISEDEVITK